jgi:hypothetical protein
MKGAVKLKEAIETRSLTSLTKAISLLADELAYQLKPPYTELSKLNAKEEDERFRLHFEAQLHLHYSSLVGKGEGLIFAIQFHGDAFSDSPVPPLPDLFYAGIMESLHIFGYGDRWNGTGIQLQQELSRNLEIPPTTVYEIAVDRLYELLEGKA